MRKVILSFVLYCKPERPIIALESIIPKTLMEVNMVAMVERFTNTFSDAGPFPPMDTINPNNIRIPK
jgi:hypothetical protein